MPINRLFEKKEIPCPSGERLHALLMTPAHGPAKRLVYLVPLVGSGASQQILLFKNMVKQGAALLSFEYRGHGKSTGTFSVEKSMEDTRTVLRWAGKYADSNGLPLHVLSNCYGALAMLSWFRGGGVSPAPETLSAVSGLIDMHQIIRADDFISHYARAAGAFSLTAAGFIEQAAAGRIDLQGDAYRKALSTYLRELFPELRVTLEAFEELEYCRVDMRETVQQFFGMQPLDGVAVPVGLPSLFFYGLRDELMGLDLAGGRQLYEHRIRSLVPHAEVRPANVDHFGRGMDRDVIVQQLCDFHAEHEARMRPLALPALARS